MPYTKKLVQHRPTAGNAASHIRSVLKKLPDQAMPSWLRERVEKTLNASLAVLTASVDYDDDGAVLGVVGEYEHTTSDPDFVGYGCRGLGLDHRWGKSEFSERYFCTKCGEPRTSEVAP